MTSEFFFVEEIPAYGEPKCKRFAPIIQLYKNHSRHVCYKKKCVPKQFVLVDQIFGPTLDCILLPYVIAFYDNVVC